MMFDESRCRSSLSRIIVAILYSYNASNIRADPLHIYLSRTIKHIDNLVLS